jgi:hypothetical protein
MKIKKSLPVLLVTSLITACSGNVNHITVPDSKNGSLVNISGNPDPILTKQDLADFDKEYSFATKKLTGSYMKRKIDKWLDKEHGGLHPDGPKLLKEIAYARHKNEDLFCSLLVDDHSLKDDIEIINEISDREAMDTGFDAFINECIPPFIGEFPVNSFTTGEQNKISLAMDSAGDFVIAWQSDSAHDGDGNGVFAKRYNRRGEIQPPTGCGTVSFPNCDSITGEFQVNTYTTGNQNIPAVAMDSDGDFVIIWGGNKPQNGGYGIYAQRYNKSGDPIDSEFQVNTYTESYNGEPKLAMDSDGDFVISFVSYHYNGEGDGIYARSYNNSGIASAPEFQINTYTTGYQGEPSIAMDSDGDFVISWSSYKSAADNRYGINARRYNSSGIAQGSEFQVNTFTTNSQISSTVAMDSTGKFVIAWDSYGQDSQVDGVGSGIFAQMYTSNGNLFGTEFQVNTHEPSDQRQPSAAMDSDGDFIISWARRFEDGGYWGIYAQRYNKNGEKITTGGNNEFHINTTLAGNQLNPIVAMDSSGDFVAAWRSNLQDGSAYGVFGQRYNNNGIPQ